MDAGQQADFLSFVHDDGKGFIGIHSATITFKKWPAYGEMIGGYFDEHPWGTFAAPVIVEDPAFPGMKQWPSAFTIDDEVYQIKDFSRTTTRVLMRLDPSKLDLTNPRVHRKDRDFAVTWAKMYGKGRVFYSTLGHVEANWDRPEMQTMIVEAIKWVLKLVEADVTEFGQPCRITRWSPLWLRRGLHRPQDEARGRSANSRGGRLAQRKSFLFEKQTGRKVRKCQRSGREAAVTRAEQAQNQSA